MQDQKEDNTQRCSGMYSKKAWGGSVDPFIQVMFQQKADAGDGRVSLVIFEYQDKNLLGRPIGDNLNEVYSIGNLFLMPNAMSS
jgi:hypothetical protein